MVVGLQAGGLLFTVLFHVFIFGGNAYNSVFTVKAFFFLCLIFSFYAPLVIVQTTIFFLTDEEREKLRRLFSNFIETDLVSKKTFHPLDVNILRLSFIYEVKDGCTEGIFYMFKKKGETSFE